MAAVPDLRFNAAVHRFGQGDPAGLAVPAVWHFLWPPPLARKQE